MQTHKKRFLIYFVIFLSLGIFDIFTHLASWVVELGTNGLVNEGSGFPDDYTVALFSAPLIVASLYLYLGHSSKILDVLLSIFFVIYVIFIVTMIFTIFAFGGWVT
ncbi:MAG: hypothetical protein AAB482_02840 [Patescibacteria group bacterium]